MYVGLKERLATMVHTAMGCPGSTRGRRLAEVHTPPPRCFPSLLLFGEAGGLEHRPGYFPAVLDLAI